jgi:hypothetical protein
MSYDLKCEQHAAPCIPHIGSMVFSILALLPLETFAHDGPLSEGAAPEQCTIGDPLSEVLKPPDLYAGDLGEAGGVQSTAGNTPVRSQGLDGLGLAGAIESANAEAVELAQIKAHEPGGSVVGHERSTCPPPRAPPASSLPARLREPQSRNPRRRSLGQGERMGAGSTRRRERA